MVKTTKNYYSIGPHNLKGLIFYALFQGGVFMAYAAMRKAGLVPEAAPDLRTVALYVRVSTGYQVDKDSLPFQKKELKNYCEHVLHIDKNRIEVFEDAGKSGKNTNRPGFERMMKKVRAGQISHVIVYKIDRISRNLVDFSLMYDDFKYNRVTFISLNEQFDTSSAIGEAVLKIILVFAELERKLTSERVKDVMIGRALSGQWNGARVPFGWEWDEEAKFPKHSETEAVFARLMYDLYEETRSTCKVRDYCNTHDVPTKRGGEWTSKTVADFIRNPMNRGDYRYNYRESARGRKVYAGRSAQKEARSPVRRSSCLWCLRCAVSGNKTGQAAGKWLFAFSLPVRQPVPEAVVYCCRLQRRCTGAVRFQLCFVHGSGGKPANED